jgi:hypothetical protein
VGRASQHPLGSRASQFLLPAVQEGAISLLSQMLSCLSSLLSF